MQYLLIITLCCGSKNSHLEKVSMGTGETLVELTNCDLVLSGAGITFYSAFVYVAWRKILDGKNPQDTTVNLKVKMWYEVRV